jgi:hypothetical protein
VARTLQPLTDLLKGSPKVLLWSSAADAVFVAAKAALVAAVPLCHPAPNAVLSPSVDASDSHVGGVLQQQMGKGWKPLAFFDLSMPPEMRFCLLSFGNRHTKASDLLLLLYFNALMHSKNF